MSESAGAGGRLPFRLPTLAGRAAVQPQNCQNSRDDLFKTPMTITGPLLPDGEMFPVWTSRCL